MELSLDDNSLLGRSLEEELEYEEGYHRHKLHMNAIDAIQHRVSPETKAWLNGGPKLRRHIPMSPGSRSYRTCGTTQSIEAQGASSSLPSSSQPSSSRPSSSRALLPRVLPRRGGLDPLDPVAIEDSDLD